jgi:undecaprenyl-diphosphatase
MTGEKTKTFEVFIQLGAILAVCWFYRRRLITVARGLPDRREAWRFLTILLVGVLPAAAAGFLLHPYIKAYLFTPLTVATALIVGGIVILIVESLPLQPKVASVDDIRWRHALAIGAVQVLSLVPGTSRSGATIIGGLVFGLSRKAATEFSFFLAIPTMFAAVGYDLTQSWHLLDRADVAVFAIGIAVSFVAALAAVGGLLRFIEHHSFRAFGYYRIGLGILIIAWSAGG